MPTKTRPRSTPPKGDPRVAELERALADRLVSETDLDALGVLDRTTRYRMVRAGTFPPPIRLTPARKAWRWSAILAWLAEREANPVTARAYFGKPGTDAESRRRA
jgi:predicted DNA-binding transcriptional regulator AlpA